MEHTGHLRSPCVCPPLPSSPQQVDVAGWPDMENDFFGGAPETCSAFEMCLNDPQGIWCPPLPSVPSLPTMASRLGQTLLLDWWVLRG